MENQAGHHQVFLSAAPAGRRGRRLALAVLLASLVIFGILAPFAKTRLAPVWAFIPCYESMLVISDLITAVLLFGQVRVSASKALVVLASAYLFTAFMTIAHLLTFPGLFSPTGLLGAGTQTTAWLYMFWHGGFPLFVIAYASLKQAELRTSPRQLLPLFLACIAAVAVAVCALVLLASAGASMLPPLMQDHRFSEHMLIVVMSVWSLSVLALGILWRKQPHSVLDLWLMIVLCAWLIDIALAAVLNGGRYDLGWYAGRIYGLLAANFVLLVLLVENGVLYANLVQMAKELRRLALTDSLTGVLNRRAFDDALDVEWRRAVRNKTSLSLLMIDIDFFKRYNDSYGHVGGDECLRKVAEVLAAATKRAGDITARYGGEEFAILLPMTDALEAQRIGQRICRKFAALGLPHRESSVAGHVTVSIGVGSLSSAAPADGTGRRAAALDTPAVLVEAADRALYATKLGNRNGVSIGERIWIAAEEGVPACQ